MTFPCSYGFAAFWTVFCMLGGFAIACICRAAGRADECADYHERFRTHLPCDVPRRMTDEERKSADEYLTQQFEAHALADSKRIQRFERESGLDWSSPNITPPGCGLPEEATNVPQRAGTYSDDRILTRWPAGTISTCCRVPIEGRLVDGKAVLHCSRCYAPISPAPSPGTGPDAGTGSANSALERGKGGGDTL